MMSFFTNYLWVYFRPILSAFRSSVNSISFLFFRLLFQPAPFIDFKADADNQTQPADYYHSPELPCPDILGQVKTDNAVQGQAGGDEAQPEANQPAVHKSSTSHLYSSLDLLSYGRLTDESSQEKLAGGSAQSGLSTFPLPIYITNKTIPGSISLKLFLRKKYPVYKMIRP